jgi:hypothetical protein
MYSEEDLASAVKAGILSEETAKAFRRHADQIKNAPAVDEEHFQLFNGFNDIFVVIACMLLLLSIQRIGAAWAPWLGALALSAVAWMLAEFFTRERRMALPAIVLLLAFVGGIVAASLFITENLALAGALAVLAAWLHWRRFKVPITVAAGAAAVIGCMVAALLSVPGLSGWTSPIMFMSGVAVFVWAMRWDASDIQRRTKRADVSFWLHLLAAPLLVHPVFAMLGLFEDGTNAVQAAGVVALYLVVTLLSIAIDRRALMVSALAYVLYAFSALLKQHGVVHLSFAITAMCIGSALLLLSAYWHPSRAFVLKRFPRTLQDRLAPLQ